eukprot:6222966-Amphidinium_carterae.1
MSWALTGSSFWITSSKTEKRGLFAWTRHGKATLKATPPFVLPCVTKKTCLRVFHSCLTATAL